jgi:predicted RecB family nuclease
MRTFSKSKLIALRQCPRRFWLEVHRPDLRQDSEQSAHRFQVGHEVGDLARRLYDPNGQGVLIDIEAEGYEAAFARSAELIKQRQPIFEAGFTGGGALAFADVMIPSDSAETLSWRMIEVKSSASVKDYHRDDVAVQTYVAKVAGVLLNSVCLAHIDSSWTYPGANNYQGLLKENDLTGEAMSRHAEVADWIAEAQQVAEQPQEPTIDIGRQCDDPFECGFYAYCSRDELKPEYPVSWLPKLSASKVCKLAEEGIDDLRNLPDELLNPLQLRVKTHTLNNTVFFDAKAAAADLAPYSLPVQFLDFETIQFPVPIWAGTRPYQQIPFQFSLHTIDENGNLSHSEFLDLSGADPSAEFVAKLVRFCGDVQLPIFVYNAPFERSRIGELAERFTSQRGTLLAINERIVDLLPIVRNHYYHPSQHGSWSIKAVLPAITPDLKYGDLEGVQDGGMAMEAFLEAIAPQTSGERKAVIRNQLLTYCKLDTYAMVNLWRILSGRDGLTL